jgi:hypothetical protein
MKTLVTSLDTTVSNHVTGFRTEHKHKMKAATSLWVHPPVARSPDRQGVQPPWQHHVVVSHDHHPASNQAEARPKHPTRGNRWATGAERVKGGWNMLERCVPGRPQQTVPDFVTRHLDADELASMLRRADDLINTGDLSSARLLLRRVAEAGDARAAFTLAGTFDPNVFKALGLQDGALDIALARLWYERAAQLGSADAPRRLQQLAIASAQ